MRSKEEQNKIDENLSRSIPVESQIQILSRIVFDLNMLAFPLPVRIEMIPDRKGFSDEWLIEHGFNHTATFTPGDYPYTHPKSREVGK